MLSADLLENILIKPAKAGANKLFIISGYASATMASRHLEIIEKELRGSIEISLIVGMCPESGLPLKEHNGFVNLNQASSANRFICSYLMTPPAVHSKVYVWFKDDTPFTAFAGSANYTQNGFGNRQMEVMENCDPGAALDYFRSLEKNSIYCTHGEVENHIKFYSLDSRTRVFLQAGNDFGGIYNTESTEGLQHVCISFLDRNGNLPQRSGLNWGQRPEVHREPNQAYIRIPSSIYNTDFFPQIGTHFTVVTDDDKCIICSRAQENGKAIHSPLNNSLIGLYFRSRMNLPNGAALTREMMENYGRTNVDFYKLDEETYLMDFSV